MPYVTHFEKLLLCSGGNLLRSVEHYTKHKKEKIYKFSYNYFM